MAKQASVSYTPSGEVSVNYGEGTDGDTALNLEMRRMISDAYVFVRGNDWNKYAANLSYEELLALAVDRIDGSQKMGNTRATRLDRIASIKSDIGAAVTTVKKKPPSAWGFASYDQEQEVSNVNTAEKETA